MRTLSAGARTPCNRNLLGFLRCRDEGRDANGGDSGPEDRAAEDLAATRLLFHFRDELLWHWSPLASVGVPLGALPVATPSLAVSARRQPKAGDQEVGERAEPSRRQLADCGRLESEHSSQEPCFSGLSFSHAHCECGSSVRVDRAEQQPRDSIAAAGQAYVTNGSGFFLCIKACGFWPRWVKRQTSENSGENDAGD